MKNSASLTAEEIRLAEDARPHAELETLGAVSQRAAVGDGARGLFAGRRCWDYFPHDHARSRAYRWGEDGLLGFSDRECRLCFALALWNGRDPILKERLFGLTNPEGNHGEDVKECYYYLDSTPTHSYAKALYKYPQAEFPYARLVRGESRSAGGASRSLNSRTRACSTTSRYFDVFVEYAKAAPEDILIRITVANRGPEPRDAARAADALVSQYVELGLHARWLRRSSRGCGSSAHERGAARSTGRWATISSQVGDGDGDRCSSPKTRRNAQRLFGIAERVAVREGRLSRIRHRRTRRRR